MVFCQRERGKGREKMREGCRTQDVWCPGFLYYLYCDHIFTKNYVILMKLCTTLKSKKNSTFYYFVIITNKIKILLHTP